MAQEFVPLWVFEATCGGVVVAAGGILTLVFAGFKRTDDAAKDLRGELTKLDSELTHEIKIGKREAAEALNAHSQRTDSRIENGRVELNTHVTNLSGRIDRLADDMVRKADFVEFGKRFDNLAARLDRFLEREH